MGKIHAGATLTPGFRDFLPAWVARQPWYRGSGVPALRPVGFFRFEDPDGEVGVETHLVAAGGEVYHVPTTYRGAPAGDVPHEALIATAEHSVLGTRWIYDGVADPVWLGRIVDLVAGGGVSEPASRTGVAPAHATGERLADVVPDDVVVEVVRVPGPGAPVGADVVGRVLGTWHVDGTARSGCLAVLRAG